MHNRQAVVTLYDNAEGEPIRLVDRGIDLPTQRKFKDSGAMIAPAIIARTGIMEYSAGQLGALFSDLPPTQIVRVMTKAEDLFCKDSLETYHAAPITINHPDEDVTVDNASYLQKGHLDGIPFPEGESLAAHIVLSDAEAIGLVENGVNQLSSGHDATLVRLSDAEAKELGYDALKKNIRNNHIAIVLRGRAGNACIADEAEVEAEITEEQELNFEDKKDDVEVKLYDQEYVSGLEAQIDSLQTKLQDALQKVSPEAIASQVNARIAFLSEVSKFTDEDVTNLSEVEAKRVALKDALGKDFSNKDDAFINVRYSILVEEGEEVTKDTDLTQALKDSANNPAQFSAKVEKTQAELSRERMIARHT